jgi:hypothetical protein
VRSKLFWDGVAYPNDQTQQEDPLACDGAPPKAIAGRLQNLREGKSLVLSFAHFHRADRQRILPIIMQNILYASCTSCFL